VNPRPRRREIEELDALLDGRITPGDASPTSRRLASIATTVREQDPHPTVELGEARKAALRDRLLADLAASPAPLAEPPRETVVPRRRQAATQARVALASTLAAVLVTAGVAVAAQVTLPGDSLYGIKRATESLRLSLAGDHVATGRLELRFAEERLGEVVAGGQDQRVDSDDHLIGALTEMDRRSLAGAELLVRLAERDDRPELFEELAAFAERQTVTLTEVYADLPTAIKPHAEDSLSVLRRIRIEWLTPAIERCDCVEVARLGGTIASEDGEGARSWFRSATLPLPPPGGGASNDPASGTAGVSSSADAPSSEGPPSGSPTDEGGTRGLDDVGRPVDDTVSGGVEDTTGTVGKVGADTTGTVGKVGEDTAGTVGEVGGDTTGTPGEVGGDTTGTVGEVVGDVGGAVEDAVDDLGDTVGKVGDDTTGTLAEVAEDTGDTPDGLLRPRPEPSAHEPPSSSTAGAATLRGRPTGAP
jgi:hypothetical protein